MTEQEERRLTRKQMDAELDLTELVRVNVCALVDHVGQVQVTGIAQHDDVVVVTVRVASDEIARVIAKPLEHFRARNEAKRHAQDDQTYGIIQGDAEIIVGGVENLRRLANSLIDWPKAEEAR